MGFLLKVFIGFWIVWIFWYITGGPLRDNRNKPFVGVDGTGTLRYYGTSTAPKK